MKPEAPIYLDYAATTPTDPRVAALMARHLGVEGLFGNPASTHAYGRAARAAVEAARAQVAALIGAPVGDIVFTSGATEANNLGLLGAVRGARKLAEAGGAAQARAAGRVGTTSAPVHLITARTEHKAVLDVCRQLEREGCRVTYLTPEASGGIAPAQVAAALEPRTALQPGTVLVSLMHANNETGAITDIGACGALCRAHGALFHVDAAQSAGKLPVDVLAMQVDLLSLTAHKLYGPKGIGALYVRGSCRALLQPLMFGGGHERGLRSGTLPVHQIVGFGLACELGGAQMAAESARLAPLRAQLWNGLSDLPDVLCNSPSGSSLPGILNVSFCGIEGESLLFGLQELALASGSACNSDSDEPSYVLRALGRDRETAQSSLRFSLGRGTTAADIERTVAAVRREVLRLRSVAGTDTWAASAPASSAAATGAAAAEVDTAITSVTAEAGAREQGTWVRLTLAVRAGVIHSAQFQVYGCPQTVQVCDWLSDQLAGRPLTSLAPPTGEAPAGVQPSKPSQTSQTSQTRVGGPRDWARTLGVPEERLTRLLVIEDALQGAVQGAVQAALRNQT